jgi:hypothetical protein
MGQGSTARSGLVSFWNLEKTGSRPCYPAQLRALLGARSIDAEVTNVSDPVSVGRMD